MSPIDIRKFVTENDDFGFEMRVGGAIKNCPGIEVGHGATYLDPVTNKPRQYDFRFWVRQERRAISFALECKNISLENPVVICGQLRERKESFHDVVISHSRAENNRSSTHRVNSGTVYREDDFVGKSILRPSGRAGESEIYDRWSQALGSAHDLIKEAATRPSSLLAGPQFGVVFPWVVLPDGALWIAQYDQNGQMVADPRPVDRCSFYVDHSFPIGDEERHEAISLSHIEFATLKGLKGFLPKISAPALDWDVWIPAEIVGNYRGS